MSDIDWKSIAQTMAADNARLCDRLITAEAVVDSLRPVIADRSVVAPRINARNLRTLIEKHDAGKAS